MLQQQNDTASIPSVDVTCIATSSCTFDPPLFAKRVNNLWFASLILSLATAAFAMLVKQWLREFFAGDYTSPRTRLRIHFYRYPGLTEWHVFELVALLPLLLLLSLALFLVGLCFFTWAVNVGIGYTTTVLVAFWGFLFIVATLSPILSPRCPYKITFLKNPMKTVRRFLAIRFPRLSDYYTDRSQPQTGTARRTQWADTAHFEEEYFAKNAEWNTDLDILLEVDAMQLDDKLFIDTIVPLVKEKENGMSLNSSGGAEDMIMNALLEFIKNRSSKSTPYADREGLPRSLTLETWTGIVAIISGLLKEKFAPPLPKTIHWSDWMEDGIVLLLSGNHLPLPVEGEETLALALEADLVTTVGIICAKTPQQPRASQGIIHGQLLHADVFTQLVNGNIYRAISRLHGQLLLDVLLQLIRCVFEEPTAPSIKDFLFNHPASVMWPGNRFADGARGLLYISPHGCVRVILDLLIEDIGRTFSTPCKEPAAWLKEACFILFTFEGWWTQEQRKLVHSWIHSRPSLDWCFLLTFTMENSTASITLAEMISDAFPGLNTGGQAGLSVAGKMVILLP